jgi:hypothetical protein
MAFCSPLPRRCQAEALQQHREERNALAHIAYRTNLPFTCARSLKKTGARRGVFSHQEKCSAAQNEKRKTTFWQQHHMRRDRKRVPVRILGGDSSSGLLNSLTNRPLSHHTDPERDDACIFFWTCYLLALPNAADDDHFSLCGET